MFALIALVASTAAQIGGAISGVRAAQANQRAANRTARDIIQRGEFDAERYQTELDQVLGGQQVSFGAQGIDATQGTQALIAEQTADIGARDIAQIRLNAEREAWGVRTQAGNNLKAARNQLLATSIGAVGAFAASGPGQTLLNRPVDAWNNFVGRRTLRNVDRALGSIPSIL